MSKWRNAAEWLGLTSTERYPEYDDDFDQDDELTGEVDRDEPEAEEAPVRELPSRRPVESVKPTSVSRPASSSSVVVKTAAPTYEEQMSRIMAVNPRTYNDARTIGENFRDGIPIIMNLTEMDDGHAKRLVDFAAGLSFGLRGNIEKITPRVFLLSPQDVEVTAEDKERIADGFYNQS